MNNVQESQKELIVCRLNDLVTDVYGDAELELIVNIDFDGRPYDYVCNKIKTVGIFSHKNLVHYIDVNDDSPNKVFLRLSEILYKTLEAIK